MGISDNVGNITLLTMLDKFNVKPDSIINVPPSFTIQPFIDNSVDAMVVFTSNEIYDIEKAGTAYNLFDPTLFGAEHYDVNLHTSQAELVNHPARVKRFREATIRGWQYALENQSEIIDLIKKEYNTLNKTAESLRFEAAQIKNSMMSEVSAIGSINEQRLQMIGADFIQLGILPKDTPLLFNDFVYKEPV